MPHKAFLKLKQSMSFQSYKPARDYSFGLQNQQRLDHSCNDLIPVDCNVMLVECSSRRSNISGVAFSLRKGWFLVYRLGHSYQRMPMGLPRHFLQVRVPLFGSADSIPLSNLGVTVLTVGENKIPPFQSCKDFTNKNKSLNVNLWQNAAQAFLQH